MTQQNGIILDQLKIDSSRAIWTANNQEIDKIYTDILQEIAELRIRSIKEVIDPLLDLLEAATLNAHGKAYVNNICRLDDEFETKAKNLTLNIKRAKMDIKKDEVRLEQLRPKLVDFKKLNLESRQELVQKFKDAETYILAWRSAFGEFKTEWGDMKREYEMCMQHHMNQVALLVDDEDKENRFK